MDESNSFEKRYSFNIAQGNPVAESTHLNGSSFSWGHISPKCRSYSSSCLSNTHATVCNKNSIASPRTKNLMQIDARIAADVQSKGLASRIVKYHESGTMLNRSMSAHNLYSKPGQFPAVTLRKTNLPYRATKQELSMIRIPPPEKSSFYGNTISSLLRSSSVVGIQSKRTEDLSRENRPIIHPPPTENDMAPTRSVLDVLKEISRKRINSDDLESEEASKKYCNRNGNDIVDTVHTSSGVPSNCIASSLSCQRYKRQRDCITPHQGVQLFEKKASPEQAKKRVCNYNNDITSSLSSSLKCKIISSPHNLNQTTLTNVDQYEIKKSTVQYHQQNKYNKKTDMRFENLESTSAKVHQVTHTQEQDDINGLVPNRTSSKTFYNANEKITNQVQSGKPRLTLFNKRCDDSESTETNGSCESLTENTGDLNDEDCAGISFVKPKKITSKRCLRNPVMERTQKSKLALMLSGLRGELYQNCDVDEPDSINEKKKLQTTEDKNTIANTNTITSALKSTNTLHSTTAVTPSGIVETPKILNQLDFATIIKNTPLSTASCASANKTSSPLVGLKLSQPNTSSENVVNIADAKKSIETNIKQNEPVLLGFSVGTTNASSPSLVNTSSFNNALKDSKTTTGPTLPVSTCSNNILKFGHSTQLTSSITSDDEKHKLPVIVQPSSKSNSLQIPIVCTTAVSTTNTKTSSKTINSLTSNNMFSNNSNVNTAMPSPNTSATDEGSSHFSGAAKLNNAFSFTAPSLLPVSSTPSVPTFATMTSSANLTKAPSTNIAATTTSASTFSTAVSSENLYNLSSTPTFTFNSTNKPLTNETAIPPSNGVPCVSFNTNGNITTTSTTTFGTNIFSTIKTPPTSSDFSFNFDSKTQNQASGGQSGQEVAKQIASDAFNSNTSTLFNSQSFGTNTTGKPANIFGNVINSSSSATPIFGSNSSKDTTQTCASSVKNKSEVLATPTVFGGNSTSSSTIPSFSFGSKLAASSTTNQNNVSIAPGGFSFSSAIANSADIGTFGFGSKSNGQPNSLNNIFSGASSDSQNKSFTIGSSANKQDNSSSIFATNKQAANTTPGFSFGSPTSMKTSFAFGVGNNSGESANIGNNVSSGFAFGSSAATKPNEMPSNKQFSFGSPQPAQQKQVPPSNANSIFGSSGANKIEQPPFNCNSGSSINLQSNTPTIGNIFTPSASNITTGPGDRPIRRATRRLQK